MSSFVLSSVAASYFNIDMLWEYQSIHIPITDFSNFYCQQFSCSC